MENGINRVEIPFTNEHFAATLKRLQALGSPYWYGACMYKCTESLLKRKSGQYPGHYTSARMGRYRDDIAKKKVCSDCVGAIKGYMWTNGGAGALAAFGKDGSVFSKYGANGCPDKSANGMFEYAKSKGAEWGTIGSIPNLPGVAVRYDGHVGVYLGDGLVVEWRGFAYGSQITKLSGRKWTHWYKLPFIDYGSASGSSGQDAALGSRLLKKGMTGADVELLQELLLQLGYALPEYGADGDFGEETRLAVISFQSASDLEPDGEYGPLTHAALMDAVADRDAGAQPSDPEQPEEPEQPAARVVEIVSAGGNVNLRCGNGTQYARISVAKPGARFEYVASAENGWHAVAVNGQVGWVSGEYSRIVG